MSEHACLVYCTIPDIKQAEQIARTLVEKRLAACCNIIPGITSFYRWENNVQRDDEVLLLIKTTARRYEQLEKEIKMMHTYSVPEIIATNIELASEAYLDWIFANTGDKF